MKIVNPDSVKRLKQARQVITELQSKLLDCERYLDDLARSAEISIMTSQPHLLNSFVETANEYLKDRLDLEDLANEIIFNDVTITTVVPD